jgi:hypothetical protein
MACKSKEIVFRPDSPDAEYIHFGSGGGFTGKVIKYYLTKDGTIYTDQDDKINKIGTAPAAQTNQIFSNYKALGLNNITLKEPGNYYQFIESHNAAETNKIIWGKEPLENKNIDTYFSILMGVVKNLNAIK